MGVYENGRGGRICVAGYYPWQQVQNLSKTAQLKRVCRWLSRDMLEAWIDSFHRISLWDRRRSDGCGVVVLLNSSFDSAVDAVLKLRTSADVLTLTNMANQSQKVTVSSGSNDAPYKTFILPPLEPWSLCMVEL